MRVPGLVAFVCLMASASVFSQDYTKFSATIEQLATLQGASLDSIWDILTKSEKIPFVIEDSVAFLYRGDVRSVAWMGDFNRWGYSKDFNNKGKRIGNTNIWMLKASFPKDARLDYKILINDETWILDPVNPNHQWSGVGGGSPNSELRMPDWLEDPITLKLIEGANAGNVQSDLLFNSQILGYQVTYSVYLPYGYDAEKPYPVVYVTDGYEYMHERMGNMVTVIDNLIHLQRIKPIIAIFIDHREPINRSNNRRMQELAMNEKYLAFLAEELIPRVEGQFNISKDPAERAVIGNSMGGLSAAYFAFAQPKLFGLAGIQSPAFWFRPEIYNYCDNPLNPPIKMFMTTGMIHDAEEGARKMKSILDKNVCTYQYKEVSQGHSWGNSRDLIDDILVYFFN